MEETTHNKLIENTNEIIDRILNDGIQISNLDTLFKIVDIQKDAYKIKYYKEEKSIGNKCIEEMSMDYTKYQDSREKANNGNYDAKNDAIRSLDYMLRSVVDFMEMLKKDATTQEEMSLIQQYARKISEM